VCHGHDLGAAVHGEPRPPDDTFPCRRAARAFPREDGDPKNLREALAPNSACA